MTISTLLEDFTTASPDLAQAIPKPEDLIGYSLGYDAGLADAASQNANATKELTAAIEELGFGYQEALHALMDALRPLFSVLASRVVPECIDASFQTFILEAIETAAKNDIGAPITLTASPVNVGTLSQTIGQIATIPFSVQADPSMPSSEVRFAMSQSETSFDANLLKSELVKALEAFHCALTDEDSIHG